MGEYFTFSGRLNRKPYWLRLLAIMLVMLGGMLCVFLLGQLFGPGLATNIGGILIGIVFIAGIVASLAATFRRLHDRDKGLGWFLFFYFVPVILQGGLAATGNQILAGIGVAASLSVSIWFLVETGFLRGTTGPNRYGPDPLRTVADDAEVFA